MDSSIACQPTEHRFISLQSTCLISQCFAEQGLAVEPLLEGTGLCIDDMTHPVRLITPQQEQRVFANAAQLSDSPLTALQLGQRMRISAYGQLGYAMLSSSTLGQAIEVMLSHPNMLGSYFRLAIELDNDASAALTASSYHENPDLHAFNLELCFSSIKAMLDDVLGQPLPLDALHLSTALPSHSGHFADFFGLCPIVAGQPNSKLIFPHAWLSTPLPLADPVTHQDALAQCRLIEARFTPPGSALAAQIISRLHQSLASPPSLEQLAERFHCTPRTLRRHLNQAGQGYQQILDELRSQRARALLADSSLPVSRIAEQLGFSETASFRHAFVRWTGMSPRSWRQAQHPANTVAG
ncbi:AraC family transcriptional regulator [Halopseudomonas pelagia]|uniref:AraC family transcriptional regulator n=1 Tax=Halopseudomonas pelagia TaxID=553151 RepID=A0AA91TZV9_9GAMM|nr:AraC family transcriptional regulator [Halopseudomonas pelagia]PCC97902.1 AraC family transcriptional regulator [Halopseudomonas pelagia]QFY56167.1 AraC family transcriptional regulator [Halopseudomonas pelagia]